MEDYQLIAVREILGIIADMDLTSSQITALATVLAEYMG